MRAFFDTISSPSLLWFWELVEFLSIIVVIVGCWGEGWSDHHKFRDEFASPLPVHSIKDWWKRFFWKTVIMGLSIEFIAFVFSFIASNREIEGLKADLAVLNGKTLELAHQYDLSTNALAEAKARLASIKPLKERLVEWLNRLNPVILKNAQAGQFASRVTMGQPEFFKLSSFLEEPDAGSFVELPLGNIQETIVTGGPITVAATIVIKPALLK
jgi:hypothetical protein